MTNSKRLRSLSIIIRARDEGGCIASTVEYLHLELDLRGVPHEIIVVDDGSKDRTLSILQEEARRLNASKADSSLLSPVPPPPCHAADVRRGEREGGTRHKILHCVQNPATHGFGLLARSVLAAICLGKSRLRPRYRRRQGPCDLDLFESDCCDPPCSPVRGC
jgi:glycosyltransferase involved in cell wall biosynthesis